jgi:hypothetical protein
MYAAVSFLVFMVLLSVSLRNLGVLLSLKVGEVFGY